MGISDWSACVCSSARGAARCEGQRRADRATELRERPAGSGEPGPDDLAAVGRDRGARKALAETVADILGKRVPCGAWDEAAKPIVAEWVATVRHGGRLRFDQSFRCAPHSLPPIRRPCPCPGAS